MRLNYAEHLKIKPLSEHSIGICEEHLTEIQEITSKISAAIFDMQNKVLYNAVVDFAKQEGITDLYLLDEEFVKTALINEAKRRTNQTEKGGEG